MFHGRNPWGNISFLPLNEFPLPECNPLHNDSYISGRKKWVSGNWCQQWMTQDSYESASCLEYGVWVALGCFAKELFLSLSGRIGLKLKRKICCPDLRSLRLDNSWGFDRGRKTEARFMVVGRQKAHFYDIPGLLGWIYSLEILLEESHKNGFQASSGFWFLDHPNVTSPTFSQN